MGYRECESCEEERGKEDTRRFDRGEVPPRMNKLTQGERQQLRDRAMQLAFGHESENAPNPRR